MTAASKKLAPTKVEFDYVARQCNQPKTVDMNKVPVTKVFRTPVTGKLVPSVIAFDPGDTTGWSYVEVKASLNNDGIIITDEIIEFEHGEIDCGNKQGELNIGDKNDPGLNPTGEAAGIERMLMLCDRHPNAVVVVEDFIVDFKKITQDRSAVSPIRITAKLEHGLWQRNRTIHLQDRSMAKTTMKDSRLTELGMYQRNGGLNHARDADRHAITWLRRCQVNAQMRHDSWPWMFDAPVHKQKKARPKKVGTRIQFGK